MFYDMFYEFTQFVTTFLYIFTKRLCSLPTVCSTHLKNCGTYKCVEMSTSWSWVRNWTICQRWLKYNLNHSHVHPPHKLNTTIIYSSHKGFRYSPPLFITSSLASLSSSIIIITTILLFLGIMKSVSQVMWKWTRSVMPSDKMGQKAGSSNKPQQEALAVKEDAREYTHDTMLIFPCWMRDVVLRVCKRMNNF